MWPDLVVILPPTGYCYSGLLQCLKPVFVEMLVTELTVETLDVAVLHGATWLDQDVSDSMALRPSQKRSTREFRSVVCSDHLWVIPAYNFMSSGTVLGTVYSANLRMENNVSECRVTIANVSGSSVPDANAYSIYEDEIYKSGDYSQSGVAYAFTIQYRFDPNEQDGSHFVKLYGVPNGTLLDKGTFVQLDDQTSFWLIEIADESEVNVAIKSLPVNFSGQINLTAESITSYLTESGSSVRWEGMTTEHTIDVLPVADTPIFPDLKSFTIDLPEGSELNLSNLQIQAYSQDSSEKIYYKLSNISADAVVKLDGSLVTDIHEKLFNQEDLNLLSLDFPDFYKKDGAFHVTAYSQYSEGIRSVGVEKKINYHFSTRADGVAAQSIQSNESIREGDRIQIESIAKPKDADEKIIYEYLVGGSQSAVDSILSDAAIVTIDGRKYKTFHINSSMPNLIGEDYQYDFSINVNTFFNGDIDIIQRVASYDEISGLISEYSELDSKTIHIAPVPGRENNSYAISYFQNNTPVEKISLKEGAVGEFGLKITSFDSNEYFELSDLTGSLNFTSAPTQTTNALGNKEYFYSMSTDLAAHANKPLTIDLNVKEDGFSDQSKFNIDYEIIKGPSKPVLETVEAVRLFIDADKELALFNQNANSPATKSADLGDDTVSYTLENVPVGVQLTNAKLLSKTKDERFATYSINPSQLANVKLLILSAAMLSDDANAFAWKAVNTEPTTGEPAYSDAQNIYLAKQIVLQPLAVDSFSNEVLVSDNSMLNYRFSGGLNGEYISVQSSFYSPQNPDSAIGQSEVIQLSGLANDSHFYIDVHSLKNNFTDFFSSTNLKVSWNTLAYGQDAGEQNVNLHLLPTPSNWLTPAGSAEVLSVFQDGYFANINLKSNTFNFIDPEYGTMLNEFTMDDHDVIDTSNAINIYGTNANDLIIAGNQSSILYGANGFNELHGSMSNDILIAGNKTDLMYGGAGSDIFQVALDLDNEATSRDQMDIVLSNFLNLSHEQCNVLSQQIQSIHQSAGDSIWNADSDATYHLNAVVGDYSRTLGNADRLVFTHGSDATEISSYTIKGETWGGYTDLIYSFAKDFADASSAHTMSDITAVLMIPDSSLDIQLLDLHNNGISKT